MAESKTIVKLREIVKNKQHMKVGNVDVDMFTASAILSVYDSLKPENQERFLKVTDNNVSVMASFSWELLDRAKKRSKEVE